MAPTTGATGATTLPAPEELATISRAAAELRRSEQTVRRLADTGELKVLTLPDRRRSVLVSDVARCAQEATRG